MESMEEYQWQLNKHISDKWKERYDLARSKQTNPEVLVELSEDVHWQVRQAATVNPLLPEERMKAIVSHPDWIMRETLTRNPNLPEYILTHLLNDPAEAVKRAAGYRSKNRSSADAVKNNPNKVTRKMEDEAEDSTNFFLGLFNNPRNSWWDFF